MAEISGPAPVAHHLFEDLAALMTGTGLLSLGLTMMSKAGLLTGGLPGLALLLSYATHLELWLLLLILNVPFYALAVLRLGWKASIRTALAMLLLSLLLKFTPQWISFGQVAPLYAAVLGGAVIGIGLLVLFRHRTTVGGFSVVAFYVQERFGIRAGYVQMAIDALILASSLMVIEPWRVAYSLAGAVALNYVLAANHRPDRYLGFS